MYDSEAIVRQAYHTAEGNVMDVPGFVELSANDGVINLEQTAATILSWAIFGAGLEWSRGENEVSAAEWAGQLMRFLSPGLTAIGLSFVG